MRFRVIAEPMDKWKAWLAGQQQGPAQPWSGEIKKLTATKYQCTNCHIFNDSAKDTGRPEPHAPRQPQHVRRRHVLA